MTATERRASASLASIFALRMLGLFLVLPVFALEAAKYPGGDDPARVGLAMGIYGLTQGLLQIPFGIASDWWGRKRVIISGLVVFALGSLVAAWAPDLHWLIAGRSLQGAGAISAAVTALLADSTRDEVRTKAMALVGGSIALMFALSLVVAPLLGGLIGLHGLFALTGALALGGIAVVIWWVPPEPVEHANRPRGSVAEVLKDAALLRLDFGVFILHAVQLAMWVAIPALLVGAGLDKASHWQVYLPAVLASFVVMGMTLFPLEKRGYLRAVFLGAVGLIGLVQLGLLWVASATPGLGLLAGLLFLFFCGFNVLEATQPSLASRVAPAHARGAALGVYNTLQSLGFFAGGAVGGWITKTHGAEGLFAVCGGLMLLWLAVAWPMKAPSRHGAASVTDNPNAAPGHPVKL
ncbi:MULTISPECIES: MFS transporter [unclassified Polaromonas]|uniref:MFS transporter n=1 Tax=unclassified Polaromonas TaxID=2638319 RepID=UPI000F080F64|nr:MULTISPECIES: MFS transporter [unclassified Polaromonas]AYQ27231.1 MFS transporter [Polaromonas sp. SP1]QGJ17928.1 MFS transporter [Polaromonas sp. Pch-P]